MGVGRIDRRQARVTQPRRGPLAGLRAVELGGIGPGPFAGMILADLGADVVRIERAAPDGQVDLMLRGRRSVVVDLKQADGLQIVRRLVEASDLLLEGFRPGVTERLGLGPSDCLALNPSLVYGRVTGWGRDGPNSSAAGHDINYIALAGALYTFGPADRVPMPPTNIIGDFAGGGMMLVIGLLAALTESRTSGRGQVVDTAMIDGVALTMISIFSKIAAGVWDHRRASNISQGACPYYATYETSDGGYISIGAVEPQFYDRLCSLLGLDPAEWGQRDDPTNWSQRQQLLGELFMTRTRDQWCELLEGTDACFAPVLTPREAPLHPHNVARGTFLEIDGATQPAPAPRFSRTATATPTAPPVVGAHTADVLHELGFDVDEIEGFVRSGVVSTPLTR